MQNKPTVFVLGAGFTHAFCASAPLLKWDITSFKQGLMKKYKGFPKVLSVLKSLESDEQQRVNIEELLSRLYSGMPYDDIYLSEGDRKVLYEDVFNYLIEVLQKIEVDTTEKDTLELFARYVIENNITCITFNYDVLLDQALYDYRQRPKFQERYWNPDSGYSFFCRSTDSLVADGIQNFKEDIPAWLLKLHGSLNWKIKKGFQKPFPLDSLIHEEQWYATGTFISKDDVHIHLENAPFVVPPILDKSILTEQPILKIIWENAFKKLSEAENVIFIGYSIPKTDIAATFLFKEALRGKKDSSVVIVNTEGMIEEKKRAYLEIFPNLSDAQFNFEGAINWIKANCKD